MHSSWKHPFFKLYMIWTIFFFLDFKGRSNIKVGSSLKTMESNHENIVKAIEELKKNQKEMMTPMM